MLANYQFIIATHKKSGGILIKRYNVEKENRSIARKALRDIKNLISSALGCTDNVLPKNVVVFVEKHAVGYHQDEWLITYTDEREVRTSELNKHVTELIDFYSDMGFILNPEYHCI